MRLQFTLFPALSLLLGRNRAAVRKSTVRKWLATASLWLALGIGPALLLLSGCNRLNHDLHGHVYVSARQVYLRDRVAAVSNRVAQVNNGQSLEVIEHGRRFLHVKTAKNEIGWIEEHAVIDQKLFDQFQQLSKDHQQDPTVATATLRDDLYVHILPGRDSEHFYLLAGNAKVQLLAKRSVVKTSGIFPGVPGISLKQSSKAGGSGSVVGSGASSTPAAPPPPLEDWWLVRDAAGRSGWLLASRVDVDVPDEIGIYAEGQHIVGTYVLARVTDANSDPPGKSIPEYVALLSPPRGGLPYDFDQVRVFTWSMNHHRYETAFRLHPIAGYLPLRISSLPIPQRGSAGRATGNDSSAPSAPAFSFQIANSQDIAADVATGVNRPAVMRTLTFQMIDTRVSRVGPDLAPIPSNHAADDKAKKAGAGAAAKKKHRP